MKLIMQDDDGQRQAKNCGPKETDGKKHMQAVS